MTKLSVNINKIATIRNARGGNTPDVVKAAVDIEGFGADGITVHPRPDERHIRYADVLSLKQVLTTEFNIEGNPVPKFMDLVLGVKPTQVTLVPDAPDALTSSAGWDTKKNFDELSDIVSTLKDAGIRTSIFVDPDPEMVAYASFNDTATTELYTEPYASAYTSDPEAAVAPFVKAATEAKRLGLQVNAGHDLSLVNLEFFLRKIPFVKEVSIGHQLICDALYLGLQETVARYKMIAQAAKP